MHDIGQQPDDADTTAPETQNGENSDAFSFAVGKFERKFNYVLNARQFDLANYIAMRGAEVLFEIQPEQARMVAWEHYFAKIAKGYRAQYQSFDYEVVDYNLYSLKQSWMLFRGPRPERADLRSGQYITFLGAAQLFGRYQRISPADQICAALRCTCLNLSSGGAGPETFLRDDVIRLANGGKAVVLQVLSGRSIGCDEYPGARMTVRGPGQSVKVDRLKLLHEIWSGSRTEGIRLARKWQRLYVRAMSELIDKLNVPVILAWISIRGAADWSIEEFERTGGAGEYPQLVDAAIVPELRARCAAYVEVSNDPDLPYGFVSRFTGKKCPVMRPNGSQAWTNDYYPSRSTGDRIASQIEAAARDVGVR